MKAIEMRLVKLERRNAYVGPAAVAAMLSVAEAAEVFRILALLGDSVVEDVLKFSLGLPAGADITDDMLRELAGGEPGLN